MKTIAERFNWVRDEVGKKLGHEWSWAAWAKDASDADAEGKSVSKNTLSAIARGEIEGPSARVVVAAAKAAGVNPAWLHHGIGSPYDLEPADDGAWPDREAVVTVLVSRGASRQVVDRLRAVTGVPDDLPTWMMLAARFIQEEHAGNNNSGGSGKR